MQMFVFYPVFFFFFWETIAIDYKLVILGYCFLTSFTTQFIFQLNNRIKHKFLAQAKPVISNLFQTHQYCTHFTMFSMNYLTRLMPINKLLSLFISTVNEYVNDERSANSLLHLFGMLICTKVFFFIIILLCEEKTTVMYIAIWIRCSKILAYFSDLTLHYLYIWELIALRTMFFLV